MATTTGATKLVLTAALVLLGCDRKNDVDKELEELKHAQQESPERAQELSKQLDEAKTNVVRLEEKVALAKQGVTDDVMKEQQDVKSALGREEKNLNEEVREAEGKAREHSTEVDKAQKQLEQVQAAQRVKAQVKTETEVVPSRTETQVEKQPETAIERARLVERNKTQPATSTTTTGATEGVVEVKPAPQPAR